MGRRRRGKRVGFTVGGAMALLAGGLLLALRLGPSPALAPVDGKVPLEAAGERAISEQAVGEQAASQAVSGQATREREVGGQGQNSGKQVQEASRQVVATVNGAAITLREFAARMPEQRAAALDAYVQTEGCDPGAADFWVASCGGEAPLERLKELTLQRLVEDRVREQAAQKAGLAVPAGYEDFLAAWEQENRERADRLAAGEVIYGPREYSESAYYRYVVSNTVLGLLAWLMEQDGGPEETELKQAYQDSIAGQAAPPAYETVRDTLVQQWNKQRYVSWFREQVRQAEVAVDRQVYAAITM
ncbi:SurA N-terminal domain-containing protein [Paenibacillus sp. NFR01]|uniref:SurA N-terminal domain-containing protein n=1 Tax=Paenibacillus sp. NFR01 TaxID=1566279 RepID=UPI0008AD94D2|nr:SurA N-terminal domain-containing protein [Paenibacillus sp. NFR01]SEU26249.1 hypothetical protein SAMN03159358_4477 [Paenibacillus sp. NFR01]